jgi:hypothetical protein
MKRLTKFFALAIVLLAFGAATFAQVGVSATATATATIITPIAITKTFDMNFGNVAVNALAGTVIMTPAGARSVTGGCTLPVTAGTVTAAAFTITGLADATYAITLPLAATTITAVSTMTVDTWTSNPTTTGVLTLGTQTLTVGATLHVAASQAAGTYVSGTPFTVTVNYN